MRISRINLWQGLSNDCSHFSYGSAIHSKAETVNMLNMMNTNVVAYYSCPSFYI